MNKESILSIIHSSPLYHPNSRIITTKFTTNIYKVSIGAKVYICKIITDEFINELEILQTLNSYSNPYIIKLEYATKTNLHYLFTEYVQGYTLFDLINKKNLTTNSCMFIFNQIIFGIYFLHSLNIVHRDIKLENIMFNPGTNQIKIIDFGFSTYEGGSLLDKYCGSVHYAAPEILNKIPYEGKPVDIWSLGVLGYILFSGGVYPFDVKDGNYDKLKYLVCHNEPNYDKIKTNRIKLLIKQMLNKSPTSRIPITKLYDQGMLSFHNKHTN